LFREEWRRSRQGKKVLTPLLRHRRSRLQPAFGQINPSERPFGAPYSNRDGIKEHMATYEPLLRLRQQFFKANEQVRDRWRIGPHNQMPTSAPMPHALPLSAVHGRIQRVCFEMSCFGKRTFADSSSVADVDPVRTPERQAGIPRSSHSLTGTEHLGASCSAATAHILKVDTSVSLMFLTAITRDNNITTLTTCYSLMLRDRLQVRLAPWWPPGLPVSNAPVRLKTLS
jgi:hypothetical protein